MLHAGGGGAGHDDAGLVVSFLHSSSTPGKSVLAVRAETLDRHAPASNKSRENNLRVVFHTDVISGDYLAQLSFTAGCFFLFFPRSE